MSIETDPWIFELRGWDDEKPRLNVVRMLRGKLPEERINLGTEGFLLIHTNQTEEGGAAIYQKIMEVL